MWYRELHNLNVIQQILPSQLVLNMIHLSQIGRKESFPLSKETYLTLSTLFYQFYSNLELSERIKGLSNFATKIADLLSFSYHLPCYIITEAYHLEASKFSLYVQNNAGGFHPTNQSHGIFFAQIWN